MIFLLSPNIGTAVVEARPDVVNALQHLADSRRCGLNEIVGQREVLQAVSACTHLSRSARSVYARLSEISTRMLNLLSQCPLYVLVTDQPSVCMRETVSGQERIVLSVEHLARDQRLGQEPALLCENLNDCNFLTWLGSFYADWNGLPNRVRFEPRNGGGQTTAQTFEAILQGRNTLCLCIADSDLKYEGDNSLGATATALREANERSGTPLAHLHILCCQEAENLVPASVLEDLYSGDATKLASTSDIQQIQKDTAHELWRYYDVKNGIRVFQFLNPVRAQFQTSWSRVFGQASDVTKEYCRRCAELNICEEKSDCTTYLARGLGTTVLADTVESFFLKKSSAEILRRIPARMENDWSRIGRVLWTWGTAGPRMAAC